MTRRLLVLLCIVSVAVPLLVGCGSSGPDTRPQVRAQSNNAQFGPVDLYVIPNKTNDRASLSGWIPRFVGVDYGQTSPFARVRVARYEVVFTTTNTHSRIARTYVEMFRNREITVILDDDDGVPRVALIIR